jgi:Glycosyl transferase family 2
MRLIEQNKNKIHENSFLNWKRAKPLGATQTRPYGPRRTNGTGSRFAGVGRTRCLIADTSIMLSVIIPTHNSEQALVRTLAALVSGATAGLISEVLIADGGSEDDTATVADVAGCEFLALETPLGRRLKEATETARAPWLMFIQPGTVLYAPWTDEAIRFVEQPGPRNTAAVFRRSRGPQTALREALSLLTAALRQAQPEQGLVIAKPFYDQLGGHSENSADPQTELIRRIGRRRLVTLGATAFHGF